MSCKAPGMSIDRKTAEPGGCECLTCGAIFIGGPEHSECGACYAAREAKKPAAKREAACHGCGKSMLDARRMVTLPKEVHLCDECVDMCHEIVHEDGGTTEIAIAELKRLRDCELQARSARMWIDGVRESVARADAEVPRHD